MGESQKQSPQMDGILNIVVQQNATELRMGTDRVPKLFHYGTPKRFMMPGTSEETLRELLGEILSPEVEDELNAEGRARLTYDAEDVGTFDMLFKLRYSAVDEVEDGMAVSALSAREVLGFDLIVTCDASPIDEDDDLLKPGREMQAPKPLSTGEITFVPAAQPVVAVSSALDNHEPAVSNGLMALLLQAKDSGASDLHLCVGEQPVLRINGMLKSLVHEVDVEEVLSPSLTPAALSKLGSGGSADLALSVPGLGRFRANIYTTSSGLAAAVRLIAERAPYLKDLNLPLRLDDLVDLPSGLVLITGPTGSGKSSTMAALVQQALMKRSQLLITLEDPIEYVYDVNKTDSLVRQRQVGRHLKSFATGLRDALREDPDILVVGEMRDLETVRWALTAAETGHLVFSSLHSRSAPYAIERIVDSFPAVQQPQVRNQLADALRVVVAQRLLPRLGGRGRVPALEVMRVNHSVSSMIREGKSAQLVSAIQSGGADGMITLERCLADMVRGGRVAVDEARAVANDVSGFESYLGR